MGADPSAVRQTNSRAAAESWAIPPYFLCPNGIEAKDDA
jgi:hypothetical protein